MAAVRYDGLKPDWTMRVTMSARHIAIIFVALAVGVITGCNQDIKIGAVISRTGAAAAYGELVENGLQLAVDEVNASGGINGGQVELLFRDDTTRADVGAKVAEELIQLDGVGVIIGALTSDVTLRVAEICEQNGVILLSPSASADKITYAGDYIFRNFPSDILEGTAMAEFAKDLGLERLVIFALDNEYGAGLTEVFKSKYESKFREVVKTFLIQTESTDDIAAMVEEAKALNPDGIYLITYVDELIALLKGIDAAGIDAVKLGTGSVTQEISRQAGAAADMLVYPAPNFDPESSDPVVSGFVSAYRAKYGVVPEIYAAHGYDALMLLKHAIEEMRTSHPDTLKLGLSSIKGFAGAAGRTSFDENGDVVRYPRLFVIHENAAMPYDTFTEQGLSILRAGQG
jgi:branched-chain amino acid transport system substrate-binding protein